MIYLLTPFSSFSLNSKDYDDLDDWEPSLTQAFTVQEKLRRKWIDGQMTDGLAKSLQVRFFFFFFLFTRFKF